MPKNPLIPKPAKLAQKEAQNSRNNNKPVKVEVPKFKAFRQIPHVAPDAKVELTAQEWDELQDFFNIFARPLSVMQNIFNRNLNTGNIQVKYIGADNAEIPKEEIETYMEQVKAYYAAGGDPVTLAKQQEEEQAQAVPAPTMEMVKD